MRSPNLQRTKTLLCNLLLPPTRQNLRSPFLPARQAPRNSSPPFSKKVPNPMVSKGCTIAVIWPEVGMYPQDNVNLSFVGYDLHLNNFMFCVCEASAKSIFIIVLMTATLYATCASIVYNEWGKYIPLLLLYVSSRIVINKRYYTS